MSVSGLCTCVASAAVITGHVTIVLMIKPDRTYKMSLPENCEPNKCYGWEKIRWSQLELLAKNNQNELFNSLQQLIRKNPIKLKTALQKS